MAHLIKKYKEVERYRDGIQYNTTRAYTVCSNCDNQIYTHTPLIGEYKYCHHCGAKFDTPVNADEVRKVINSTKSEE